MSLFLLVTMAAAGAPLEVTGCPATLGPTVQDEYALAGLQPDAVARVALRCEAEDVEVLIVTPAGLRRTRALRRGTDPRGEVRVAVQVVDLLHAVLAEERFSEPPAVAITQQPPIAPRSPPSWSTTLAGGFTFAPGGFGVEPSVAASVNRGVGLFEFGVAARATVRGTTLAVDQGRALIGVFDAQARAGFPVEVGAWTLTPHAGVGVLAVWALGTATSEAWKGTFGVVPTFAIGAGLSAWRALSSWLLLGLGAEVLAAPLPVKVELPGAGAAVGLPMLAFELGVSLR